MNKHMGIENFVNTETDIRINQSFNKQANDFNR